MTPARRGGRPDLPAAGPKAVRSEMGGAPPCVVMAVSVIVTG